MSHDLSRFILEREHAALVVVDIQERLVAAMPPDVLEATVSTVRMLLEAWKTLELPVVTTEQYTRGLGATLATLQQAGSGEAIEKMSFSCCGEERFNERLEELGVRQIVLVGMETHVCVYQTALDLLERGYSVFMVRDAVCSRNTVDYKTALLCAAQAGVTVCTAEMVLFQLLKKAGGAAFKAISAQVKER